jgi:hypothetical protein
MTRGDRVTFLEEGLRGVQLGTVTAVSHPGYVQVLWDDGTRGYFSPVTAAERLQLAQGDDALPRHRWRSQRAGGHPADAESAQRVTVCDECGVEQTDENEFEPCRDDEDAAAVR